MHHNIAETDTATVVGTVGGTVLSVASLPHSSDLVTTIILAGVGAVTSFFVTLALKRIFKNIFNEKEKDK